MKPGHVVRHRESGARGVVVSDPWKCCSAEEVPVVWEGTTSYLGTDRPLLEDLGPEGAQADFEKCGGGLGDQCCIFLTVGPGGFSCERFGGLRYSLIFVKDRMFANREPSMLYPNCQLQTEDKE